MGTEQRLTLTALQMMIRDSVVLAMPGSYWVTAEIAELKVNYSGHCYLEIVEKNQSNNSIKSRARAIIWAARYRSILPIFESVTGETLGEGINVLIKVTVEYHEIYGLSLNISDIDPSYTVGDMAMKRMEIIRRLTDDGIINMNSELEFPALPGRIAVISSESSAGYTDFLKHLTENSYGYGFKTKLFNSPMQGEDTEKGIIAALDQIANQINQFDLVAIIRGGGSTSDLRWFDSYMIAYLITQFPIPVLTGIGHEKDVTITDLVAWKSFKTPTAVASFLIETTHETGQLLQELAGRLIQAAKYILMENGSIVMSMAQRIIPASSMLISETRRAVSASTMSLSSKTGILLSSAGTRIAILNSTLKSGARMAISSAKEEITANLHQLEAGSYRTIRKNEQQITATEGMIRMADPKNILKKGFSLTKKNGMVVRSVLQLKPGDKITSILYDGSVNSEVTE